ncbi:MAG TPA: hypothetical protein VK449_08390, partial [Anaerolineales bacterium]|nr:hypothetical protein [Anaerolineales bacterium]
MSLLAPSYFRGRRAEMLEDLRQMVLLESPSTDKAGLDRLGEWLAARFEAAGGAVERLPQAAAGDHWLVSWGSGEGGTLLLHH